MRYKRCQARIRSLISSQHASPRCVLDKIGESVSDNIKDKIILYLTLFTRMYPIANFPFRMPRNAAQSALERLEGKIAPVALAEVYLGYQKAFHPIYCHRYRRTKRDRLWQYGQVSPLQACTVYGNDRVERAATPRPYGTVNLLHAETKLVISSHSDTFLDKKQAVV